MAIEILFQKVFTNEKIELYDQMVKILYVQGNKPLCTCSVLIIRSRESMYLIQSKFILPQWQKIKNKITFHGEKNVKNWNRGKLYRGKLYR